ncbi:hypothetical protein [Cupriavidus sp. D39]|uniref:hypothetical protein n=1 Tax=Cupriavidus sp. D39 TaxID=2997877 RepID=UPI00226F573B|nr:hypothetical protein [Cupriavidus sp. D39]MCY0853349.1 hypothetical protein [Cupriavidus sp. D39]
MDWSAGDVDEFGLAGDLERSVEDAIDDFRSGDGLVRLMIAMAEPDGQILVAMGQNPAKP